MSKISAIDVGSNAMRMVVGEVDESWRVNTLENIRLPVRLGQDVFSEEFSRRRPFNKPRKLSYGSSTWRRITVYRKCVPLPRAQRAKLRIVTCSLIASFVSVASSW